MPIRLSALNYDICFLIPKIPVYIYDLASPSHGRTDIQKPRPLHSMSAFLCARKDAHSGHCRPPFLKAGAQGSTLLGLSFQKATHTLYLSAALICATSEIQKSPGQCPGCYHKREAETIFAHSFN